MKIALYAEQITEAIVVTPVAATILAVDGRFSRGDARNTGAPAKACEKREGEPRLEQLRVREATQRSPADAS